MAERRRYPRLPVSWPVLLRVAQETLVGRAVDASDFGIRILAAPTAEVKAGVSFHVEIMGEPEPRFHLVGQVRHVGPQGVGLESRDPLPQNWSRWTTG
jgi:hypothetical protein